MKIPFREHHLFALLDLYDDQKLPLDLCIHRYFRKHPALGSKDRGFIAETAYALMRWKRLLDYLDQSQTWPGRYQIYSTINLKDYIDRSDIPLAIRVSFSDELFELIATDYGIEKAIQICLECNQQAPTTIRVNRLKTDRETLLKQFESLYEATATPYAPDGISFGKKINFFSLPEFKAGFFEVQDEGSQLLANLVQAKPGDLVLDYCAGSGGKTLSFATRMKNKGQIYLHDIRPHILLEARKRLKRAGIYNSQLLFPDSSHLNKIKKKMNWILVDAPCSGTGTLRRNPDMKEKFNQEMLLRLQGQQRVIFEKALSFLHPRGRIVYSTCSLLKAENELQMEHFLKTYNLTIEGEPWHSLPTMGGMDGFFGVVLKRA